MPSVAVLPAFGVQKSIGLMCASGVYDTALGLGDHSRDCRNRSSHGAVFKAPIISCQRCQLRAKARL